MSKAFRLVLPIIVAVVLGPLIAGVAFFIFAVGNTIVVPRHDSWSILEPFRLFPAYILAAYGIGGYIAFLAGLLMSIWTIWRPPSAGVAIAAAIIATVAFVSGWAALLGGNLEDNALLVNLPLILVLAIVAALGCWLLMRRYARSS